VDLETALELLHLPQEFDPLHLKQQYRQRAKACHPDLYPGDEAATCQFQALSWAYGYLLQYLEQSPQAHLSSPSIDPSLAELATAAVPNSGIPSQTNPLQRSEQLQRIRELARTGKLLQAIVALDHLIQQFPHDPRLKTRKGWIYYSHARLLNQQRRIALARKYLKASLKLALGDRLLHNRVEALSSHLERQDQYG
jgi:tetratricopeptide (TPR) repeat protein